MFADYKFKKTCQDEYKLIKKYGPDNARKIILRIEQLRAADSLGIMIQFKIGRCHLLTGDFQGMFALDIQHPYRLIIEPIFYEGVDTAKVDYNKVKKITIIGVEDYHG